MSIKPLTLDEIATSTNGQLIYGNNHKAEVLIERLTAFDEPHPNAIAFTNEINLNKLASVLSGSSFGAIFAKKNAKLEDSFSVPLILVEDPLRAMIVVARVFHQSKQSRSEISPKSEIDPTAKLGKDVSVGAFACIGARVQVGDRSVIHPHVVIYDDVKIGADVVVHASVVIREGTVIGNNVTLQPGAVIGSDGFGYIPDPLLGLAPVPQVGTVKIADQVDIGANTCVDRATFGTTSLGLGVKVDNLVQVGHNNKIGSHTVLCGQVGLAGSSKIGNKVVLGGAVKVNDHIEIADGVRVGGAATVLSSILEAGDYAGEGPLPKRKWIRRLKKIDQLLK